MQEAYSLSTIIRYNLQIFRNYISRVNAFIMLMDSLATVAKNAITLSKMAAMVTVTSQDGDRCHDFHENPRSITALSGMSGMRGWTRLVPKIRSAQNSMKIDMGYL